MGVADWQRLSENGLGKRQRRRRRQIKRQMRKLWIRTAWSREKGVGREWAAVWNVL